MRIRRSILRSRVQAGLGFLLMIVGVLLIIYGIYKMTTYPFETSNIHSIVSNAVFYILVGAVVFLEGVVIQGFKRIYALVLHLGAVIPYYFAIQAILSQGAAGASSASQYLTASEYYLAAGVILNLLGLIANNLRVRRQVSTTPSVAI
jgi:hypothetical protein